MVWAIVPRPECFPHFGDTSLTKLPFGVTKRRWTAAILCPQKCGWLQTGHFFVLYPSGLCITRIHQAQMRLGGKVPPFAKAVASKQWNFATLPWGRNQHFPFSMQWKNWGLPWPTPQIKTKGFSHETAHFQHQVGNPICHPCRHFFPWKKNTCPGCE